MPRFHTTKVKSRNTCGEQNASADPPKGDLSENCQICRDDAKAMTEAAVRPSPAIQLTDWCIGRISGASAAARRACQTARGTKNVRTSPPPTGKPPSKPRDRLERAHFADRPTMSSMPPI
jgi:hypothetical protein